MIGGRWADHLRFYLNYIHENQFTTSFAAVVLGVQRVRRRFGGGGGALSAPAASEEKSLYPAGATRWIKKHFNTGNVRSHMSKSEVTVNPPPVTEPAQKSKPRRKTRWLVAGLVALLLAGLGWRIHEQKAAGAKGANAGGWVGNFPVPVTLGHARQKDVPIYLDGLGTVQAFNTVTVHTRVDGELVKVAFTEGQDVKAGDILAQIDPAPFQAAMDQATAKKAQDAAQLANARLDLKRYADLLATDGTTEQTYDTQKALVDQLAATVQADQAAVESAKVNLDYTTVRSPIDGRTGIRQVDQGNIVHASDAGGLVVLTQLKPISIVFTLPETALAKLQAEEDKNVDQAGTNFTVLAVARDNTNVLATGFLAVIDNEIDPTTGTLKLKANFANENLRLWPGQFVNTRLLLETREDSVVVPASVVQRGPDGAFAFVVQGDQTNQTVRVQPLKVAQIDNGEALIDNGLEAGDLVVVDGQYKLQDGSPVKAITGTGGGAGGYHRKRPEAGQGTNQDNKP
jgi:multidrug efflux system membrane fusion protein